MFAVGGGDEALGADVSFSSGCEQTPKLRSVIGITSIIVKDALRYAVRDQTLCNQGEKVGRPRGTIRHANVFDKRVNGRLKGRGSLR